MNLAFARAARVRTRDVSVFSDSAPMQLSNKMRR
jgi:hypothetical protein